MKISDQLVPFKRYAIHERGMTRKSCSNIMQVAKNLDTFLEFKNLKQISTNDVLEYLYENKERKGWTPKTFCNHRQSLITFFRFCCNRGLITKNPVLKIEKPKLPKSLPRFLTKVDIRTLLEHFEIYDWKTDFERLRNICIFKTFLFSGLRLNELLSLKNTDVILSERTIKVIKGKGNKDRTIPIHNDLYYALKIYENRKKIKHLNGVYFFVSQKRGMKLSDKNIYSVFKKIQKNTGIYFTPHMLRHTFGKCSVEANLHVFKLKEIMGHSSVSTTQIYMSVSMENIKNSFVNLELV
jgi:site-specific recombinase XerD